MIDKNLASAKHLNKLTQPNVREFCIKLNNEDKLHPYICNEDKLRI